MNKNRSFLLLTLAVGIGGGLLIAKYANTGAPVTTGAKKSSAQVTTTTIIPTAPSRSARTLHLDKSTNVKPELVEADQGQELTAKEQLEQRYRNFREDGRKQFEELVGGDREKMGQLFRAAFGNPEFQEIMQNSRSISEKWRTAADEEKPALMEQLTGLRARGLGLAKQELTKLNAPAPTVKIEGPTIIPAGVPADGTPADPATPPPVIIM